MAREMLSSRNRNAGQQGTLGSRVDQFCTVREKVTRSHEPDCDMEVLSKSDDSLGDATASSWSQQSGLNPEGKYVPQVSVTTCTRVTGIPNYSIEVKYESSAPSSCNVKGSWMKRLSSHRREETFVSTNLLRVTEDDEAFIDALLQELEFEIAYPVKNERIELIAGIEGMKSLAKYWGTPDVLTEKVGDIKRASSSKTMIKAEWKCGSKGFQLTGRFERPNSLFPIGVIKQHPALSHRRLLWVPHRKHGRRKHERLQMGWRGLCWPTHRKHGRWKTDQTMRPPLPLQLRLDGEGRWCSQRKRVKWKSGNRDRSNACPSDDAAMFVRLHPLNI